MIFNKSGKKLTKDKFVFSDNILEHCTEYKYLGILFKPSGSFTEAVRLLCKKASKAIFCIRKLLFSEDINVLPHLKLFDACVKPILLYCSEVWSLYMIKDITNLESKYWSLATIKVQIKFAKTLIGVNKSAVNLAVLAELGMYPVFIEALKLSIGFWLHVIKSDNNCLLKDVYCSNLQLTNGFAKKIEQLLATLNFSHVWKNHDTISKKRLLYAIHTKLNDRYLNYWKENIFCDNKSVHGNKLRTYRQLKENYKLETYLLLNIDRKVIGHFAKIRISNSVLRIEQGRHTKTPVEERICPLCLLEVEDEFHFTLKCTKLNIIRDQLFSRIREIVPSFFNMTNEARFKFLYTCVETDIIRIIVKFISDMYISRNALLSTK